MRVGNPIHATEVWNEDGELVAVFFDYGNEFAAERKAHLFIDTLERKSSPEQTRAFDRAQRVARFLDKLIIHTYTESNAYYVSDEDMERYQRNPMRWFVEWWNHNINFFSNIYHYRARSLRDKMKV